MFTIVDTHGQLQDKVINYYSGTSILQTLRNKIQESLLLRCPHFRGHSQITCNTHNSQINAHYNPSPVFYQFLITKL